MYLRKLPSGLWQATIRDASGKRHSKTDKLKTVVKQWAADQETAIARGEYRDPRLGNISAGEWYAWVAAARVIDPATRAKHARLWATHCEPQWAGWPMSAVTRMEAQEWVNRLQLTRRARHQGRAVTDQTEDVPVLAAETIGAAVHLMGQLYTLAMRETPPVVTSNPFAGLELPVARPNEVLLLRARGGRGANRGYPRVVWRDERGDDPARDVGWPAPRRAARLARSPRQLAARHHQRRGRDDPLGAPPMTEEQEVPPHRTGPARHHEGHGGLHDRPLTGLAGVHRARGRPRR